MIEVLILLCMAAPGTHAPPFTDAEKEAWYESWKACNSGNATVYKRVTIPGPSPCEPELIFHDAEALVDALPKPDNPAWRPPNWVKYECHAGAGS